MSNVKSIVMNKLMHMEWIFVVTNIGYHRFVPKIIFSSDISVVDPP